MAVKTASGTKIYIGDATTANTKVLLLATSNFVEVGEVQTLGEFGDESPAVTFAAIGDARIRKTKGARDAGIMTITCGRDPLDAGQAAMIAAENTDFEYAIKIVANDAATDAYTDTTYVFRGLVMSRRENYGTNDNVVTVTFNVGINSEVFQTLSALI